MNVIFGPAELLANVRFNRLNFKRAQKVEYFIPSTNSSLKNSPQHEGLKTNKI